MNWTSDEIQILRQNYNTAPRVEIEALLPTRGWKAIRHKAQRFGLFRPLKTMPSKETISTADLAYFAGLFDGEGSVMLHKQPTRSSPQRQTYYLIVSLGSTHLPTIEWVKQLWGMGAVRLTPMGKRRRKPFWQWNVLSNQALHVLKLILPFLKIKRQDAEIGIAFQEFKLKTTQAWGWDRPTPLIQEEQRFRKLLAEVPTRRGHYE